MNKFENYGIEAYAECELHKSEASKSKNKSRI